MEPPSPPPPPPPQGEKRDRDDSDPQKDFDTSNLRETKGLKLRDTDSRKERRQREERRQKFTSEYCPLAKVATKNSLSEIEGGYAQRSDKKQLFLHMMKAHERRNKFTARVKQKEDDRKQKELDQKFDKHNDGLSQDRGKLTETYGEEAAAIYMANKYKNTQLFTGFASGPGFDQVWIERADNQQIIKIFIVEAKGKNATLSKKKTETKGYQMDCEWVAKTVLELEANNNRRPGGDDNTADSLVPISQKDNNISYEDYKLTEEGTKSAFYRSKSDRTIVIDHMKKALLSDPPPSLVGLVIGIDGDNIVGEHALPLGGTYPKRNNDGEYCYNSSGEPYGIVNNE